MIRLGILTTIWQRHELARITLRHWSEMQIPGVELVLVAVGSEGAASQALADEFGWLYVEAPNEPVSDKHNAGARACRDLQLDGVMTVGSDDLVNAQLVDEAARQIAAGTDFWSLRGIWYYDAPTGRLAYAHRGFPGAGTTLSRHLLDTVAWTPWDRGLNRFLDASLINRCRGHARTMGWLGDLRQSECRIVDIKTDVNMWDFETILARQGEPVWEADAALWLHTHFENAAPAVLALGTTPTQEPTPTKKARKGKKA